MLLRIFTLVIWLGLNSATDQTGFLNDTSSTKLMTRIMRHYLKMSEKTLKLAIQYYKMLLNASAKAFDDKTVKHG